jgi:3-oxoacyl-(acyl-carrier-protein) synthase
MERAVAITGIGLVTPLGLDAATTWAALLAGTRGVGPISRFDATAFRTRIAAEVKGFDPEAFIGSTRVREADRFTQFAIAASLMAWRDAAIGRRPVADGPRAGLHHRQRHGWPRDHRALPRRACARRARGASRRTSSRPASPTSARGRSPCASASAA